MKDPIGTLLHNLFPSRSLVRYRHFQGGTYLRLANGGTYGDALGDGRRVEIYLDEQFGGVWVCSADEFHGFVTDNLEKVVRFKAIETVPISYPDPEPSGGEIQAAIEQLRLSDRGQRALDSLYTLLYENGGDGLDTLNQKAIALLLNAAFVKPDSTRGRMTHACKP